MHTSYIISTLLVQSSVPIKALPFLVPTNQKLVVNFLMLSTTDEILLKLPLPIHYYHHFYFPLDVPSFESFLQQQPGTHKTHKTQDTPHTGTRQATSKKSIKAEST